ncbi:MAG: hypothetical protein K2O28_03605 [Clostridia bacterium]|nr:hypothetical protein [Clostridia bacterium]
MKKRKLLFLSVLFVLIATLFLSSCIVHNTNKAKKIPVYGNYRLAGSGTATHGKEQVLFRDIIGPAIKDEGYTVNEGGPFMTTVGTYYGNNYFFMCKFFQEQVGEMHSTGYWDYRTEYCFGTVDLVTLKVHIFCIAENVVMSPSGIMNVLVYKFENLIIYSVDRKYFEIVNADTLDRVSADVEVPEDYTLCYASEDMMLFKDRTEDNYFTVNYNTGERDDEQTPSLIEKLNAESYVEYDGKNYVLDIADEAVTFTERDADNSFSVTIDELRERSEEFRKVEQIFDCKLTFNNALVQNGEIYLSASYYDPPAWGMTMYSKCSTVACFLYEPETSTFKYIGWLQPEATLMSVIKL